MFFLYLMSNQTYFKYFEMFKMAAILGSSALSNRKLYGELSPTTR